TASEQQIRDAGALPVRSSSRVRRVIIFGALLASVAPIAFFIVSSRRSPHLPFETVRTTKLTSDGQSFKAAISPDGRYIAHTLLSAGQESLRVRRATTLHDIEIVPPSPHRYSGITFSPDGETVYYVTRTPGAEPSILYRVPVMGGSSQKLKDGLDSPITFSPDGTRFAFVRESPAESVLMVADLDSGREERLISRKLPETLDYPAWSPDGRIIACTVVDSSMATSKGSDARILEVRVSDRTERVLSSHTWGYIKQLSWFGDGRGLAMSACGLESRFYHLWYVSYPGGVGRKITDGINFQTGASVSADSRQIVTVEENKFFGIWRINFGKGVDPEPVVSGYHGTSAPLWTPDGRIVFEQELNGHRSIWTVDVDGTNQKQLTMAGNSYDHSISGDGRTLAYVSDRSGSPAIWTMDIDGGNQEMKVKADAEAFPQLSPDGKWITYTTIGSRHWTTLWRVAARGGRPVELSDKLWQHPAISPDGKSIAGFYADQQLGTQRTPTSIAVIHSDGGPPWQVIPISLSVSTKPGIRWTPNGAQLIYVDGRKDGDNLWSQPLNGGRPHQLTQFHSDTLFSFDWSHDGKQLVFNRGVEARDVVLVQDAQRK
ncbi:MAG: hypothetical protein LAQ69_52145, partial [Acidobacteriia bacterium]|nr:hypothetical protein [Terriglobia bacterium]